MKRRKKSNEEGLMKRARSFDYVLGTVNDISIIYKMGV